MQAKEEFHNRETTLHKAEFDEGNVHSGRSHAIFMSHMLSFLIEEQTPTTQANYAPALFRSFPVD